MIVEYSITIFLTQLIFIGCRTWNVKSIAKNDIKQVLISGTFVHLSWLVSIGLTSISMIQIIQNFKLEYLIIVFFSLAGGLLGSYIGLKERKN